MNIQFSEEPLVNYIRVHRTTAGLTQKDVGMVLGYRDHEAVAQHERFRALPPLLIALGYEVIFQEPVSEIFAGLRFVMEQSVEERLREFENELRNRKVDGYRVKTHARKLEWLEDRRTNAH